MKPEFERPSDEAVAMLALQAAWQIEVLAHSQLHDEHESREFDPAHMRSDLVRMVQLARAQMSCLDRSDSRINWHDVQRVILGLVEQ